MSTQPRDYPGASITVSFDIGRCIHAAECIRGLPDVFDTGRRPWILPDAATPDEVAAIVQRCPSGALQFRRSDGGGEERVDERVTVLPTPDGPLYLRGALEIIDGAGAVIEQASRAALCRCGHSANKPFCDNSHLDSGF